MAVVGRARHELQQRVGASASRAGPRRSPSWREEWEPTCAGEPRAGLARGAARCSRPGEEVATRDAGKTVMQALKPFTPTMVGGAADLVESTKTEFEGGGVFAAHARRPQHRLRHPRARDGLDRERDRARRRRCCSPYGSTFLIFSDYMRPAVRLSALDGAAVGSGSGRTTRSASARTARRTSRSSTTWRCARSRTSGTCGPATRTRRRWRGGSRSSAPDGPVALALTRQKLPTLDRTEVAPAEGALRGAYALWQRGDGRARRDRDRDRLARSHVALEARAVAGRRTSASSRCRAGSSSRSRPTTTATRCCRPTVRGAALGRGRASRSAGSAGSATRDASVDRPLRRLGARASEVLRRVRHHGRERSRRARPRCSSGSR